MAGMIRVWFPLRLSEEEALHRNLSSRFVELCGVSKATAPVDYAMLEYCIREDLKAEEAP